MHMLRLAAESDGYEIEYVGIVGPHHEGWSKMVELLDEGWDGVAVNSFIVTDLGFSPKWMSEMLPEDVSEGNLDPSGKLRLVGTTYQDDMMVTRLWDTVDISNIEIQYPVRLLHTVSRRTEMQLDDRRKAAIAANGGGDSEMSGC